MVFAIESWFRENNDIESYELEDFLEEVLNAEFDLKVEDGSIPEISRLICLFFRLCQENRVEEIQSRLQALPKPSLQNCQHGEDDTDDDIDSNFEEEPTASSTSSTFVHQQHATVASSQSTTSSGGMDEMEVSEEKVTEEDGWKVISRGKRK
uniref:Pre-rRNA-processing protein TSR2 homolog n=2 Tax=Arion vulgaris TaxID=1028688 RepID=A0A0B6YZA8_9EUPU